MIIYIFKKNPTFYEHLANMPVTSYGLPAKSLQKITYGKGANFLTKLVLTFSIISPVQRRAILLVRI